MSRSRQIDSRARRQVSSPVAGSGAQVGKRQACRPRSLWFEALEDRSVPAVVNWIGAVDTDWSNNANWFNTTSSTNVAPVDGDDIVFNSGFLTGNMVATNLNNDIAGLDLNTITFDAGEFTVTGGNAVNVTSSVQSINNGDDLLGITINGTAAVFVNILSGGAPGTEDRFILSASNGFTGGINIQSGVLVAAADNALGTTDAGTSVQFLGRLAFDNIAYTAAEQVTMNSGAIASQGTSSFVGNITLADDSGIAVLDGSLDLSGIISGNFGFESLFTGTLILSGANTFTGGVAVSAGTLQVANATALGTVAGGTSVAAGATLDFAGITYGALEALALQGGTISGSSGASVFNGTIALTTVDGIIDVDGTSLTLGGAISGGFGFDKTGSGALSLGGNNTFTGAVDIIGGTLQVTSATALGTVAGGTTANAGTTLDFAGVNYSLAENVTLASALLSASTGVSTFNGNILLTTGDSSIDVAGTSLTLGGVISGTVGFDKVSSGVLSLGGNNTFTGVVDVISGLLRVTANNALGTVAGGTNVNAGTTLDFANVAYTTAEGVTLDNATISASTGTSVFNGAILMTTAGGTFDVAGTQLTLGGVISGSFGVTKDGVGILALGATNTYTGVTAVDTGTLRVSVDGALGTIAGNTTVASGATLDFFGVAYATAENFSVDGGTISASAGFSAVAGDFTMTNNSIIDVDGTSLDLNGVISGAFDLLKTGTGLLILDGSNLFSGTLTVAQGTLGGSGSIAGALVVQAGASLNPGLPGQTAIFTSAGLTTLDSSSTFAATINTATPGSGYDQLIANGVSLAGAILNATGTLAATPGAEIILISNTGIGAVTGTFTGLAEGALIDIGPTQYQISYVGGVGGNDVTLTAIMLVGGNSTVGVFDPATATWYLRDANDNLGPPDYVFQFGAPGMIGVTGDWDGDGVDTIGVFDPNTAMWYLRNQNNNDGPPDFVIHYGFGSGVVVVGDWDGNGTDTIGIYNPSTATWYLRNSNTAGSPDLVFSYGFGANPVVGNWDGIIGDGIGVYDANSATWYLRNSPSAGSPDAGVFAYGFSGVRPVVGDWDFNGSDGIGVFSQSGVWYLRDAANAGSPNAGVFQYGGGAMTPVTGNWTAPVLLTAAGNPSGAGSLVAESDLGAIYAEALSRWGVSGSLGIQLTIGDLPGNTLAQVVGSSIIVDRDAAGHGWFIDSTPEDDSEFADGDAPEGMDLLTAVMHELGHVFGIQHSDDGDADLMARTLRAGVRQEPTSVAIDAVLSSDAFDLLLV